MKANLTLSLDIELIKKLKQEINYSDLVEQQVRGYYDIKDIENLQILKQNLEKTKQIIKENRKKQREIVKKIENLKERERKIIEKVKNNVRERKERDPIIDPDYFQERGLHLKEPGLWKKHLDFLERGEK